MAFRPNAMHDLAIAHPRLFVQPPVITSHLPIGWLRLADELCADIELELGEDSFRVSQLKEEAGVLRFSFRLSGTDDDVAEALSERGAAAPALAVKMARIRQLIAKAAERSTTVCAKCGEPGSAANAGAWYAPLCVRHREAT